MWWWWGGGLSTQFSLRDIVTSLIDFHSSAKCVSWSRLYNRLAGSCNTYTISFAHNLCFSLGAFIHKTFMQITFDSCLTSKLIQLGCLNYSGASTAAFDKRNQQWSIETVCFISRKFSSWWNYSKYFTVFFFHSHRVMSAFNPQRKLLNFVSLPLLQTFNWFHFLSSNSR